MRYKEVVFITIAVRASNLFNNTQKQPLVSPSVFNPKIDCRSHDLSFYRADIRVSSVSVLQGIVCILIFVGVAMAMEHPRWAANIRYEKRAVATHLTSRYNTVATHLAHTAPSPQPSICLCLCLCLPRACLGKRSSSFQLLSFTRVGAFKMCCWPSRRGALMLPPPPGYIPPQQPKAVWSGKRLQLNYTKNDHFVKTDSGQT